MDSIKLDGITTKTKWKIHTCFLFYFKFWRYFLAIPVLLFLILCQLLHISRYDFLEIFRTSFNLIWKNIFLSKFYFVNGFIHPETAKVFCQLVHSTVVSDMPQDRPIIDIKSISWNISMEISKKILWDLKDKIWTIPIQPLLDIGITLKFTETFLIKKFFYQ